MQRCSSIVRQIDRGGPRLWSLTIYNLSKIEFFYTAFRLSRASDLLFYFTSSRRFYFSSRRNIAEHHTKRIMKYISRKCTFPLEVSIRFYGLDVRTAFNNVIKFSYFTLSDAHFIYLKNGNSLVLREQIVLRESATAKM